MTKRALSFGGRNRKFCPFSVMRVVALTGLSERVAAIHHPGATIAVDQCGKQRWG